MDRLDASTRSLLMGRIRARGAKSTEKRLRSLLIRSGIRGWKLGHDVGLPGKPDVVFPHRKVAVFVDGCFWHGCRRCRSLPVSNVAFWRAKIHGNQVRDRRVTRELRELGWKVSRIWEHELRHDAAKVLERICSALRRVHRNPLKARDDQDSRPRRSSSARSFPRRNAARAVRIAPKRIRRHVVGNAWTR